MQIHEIFKRSDEGILKGIKTLASAAGGAISAAANKSLGIDPSTYQTRGKTSANPYVGKEAALRKMTQPLAANLAQQQFNNWNAALKTFGTDNPATLDKTSQDRLRTLILKNANKTFDVYNLLNLSKNVDPAYQQEAIEAEKNILAAINNIMEKPGQQTLQDWNTFVTNAQEVTMLSKLYSSHGNNQVTFDGKNYYIGTRRLDPRDPGDNKIISQALARGKVDHETEAPGQTAQTKPPAPPAPKPTVDTKVPVGPGKRIRVRDPRTNGIYFKTAAGWTNEIGQKINNPSSIEQLEQYADVGYGKEENIPPATPRPKSKSTKQRKGKTRVR